MKFPEQYRIPWQPHFVHVESKAGDPFGYFLVPAKYALKRKLMIIATDGAPDTEWEHASVSLPDFPRLCPSWDEMCLVKDLFWDDSECVVQFHPPKQDYVNIHPGVLHLWRWRNGMYVLPPKVCV